MSYKDLKELSYDELIELILDLQNENDELLCEIDDLKTQRNNKSTKDFNDYRSLIGGIFSDLGINENDDDDDYDDDYDNYDDDIDDIIKNVFGENKGV